MSTVMRPSGPLPPRVYWMRRLVLVFVVLLVVGALWWLSSGLASAPKPSSAPTRATPTVGANRHLLPGPRQPASQHPSTHGVAGHHRPGTGHHQRPAQRSHRPARHHRRHSQPLAVPTGPCSPADVAIQINAADTTVGHPTTATLSLTSLNTPACTLKITPTSMVLRITSGADVVWSSDDCPDALPVRQVVVRTRPATTYDFRWDGRRSVQGCTSPGPVAQPGGYWVEAALVTADAHKGYFDVSP